jgi:hypothetical protein
MRPILATSASPRRAKLLGRRGTAMALDSQGWRIAHNPNSVVTDCDRRPVLRATRSLRPQMFRDGQMKPSSPRRFLEPGGAALDRACRVLHGAAFASDSGVSETCCKNLAKRAVLPCTGIAGVQGRFNSVSFLFASGRESWMPLSRRTLWIGAALAALVTIVVLAVVYGGGGGGGGY